MKKLVVALMLVTLSLVSCGKNNSTNTNPNATAVNPITNTAVQNATQVGSMIDSYQQYFGLAAIDAYTRLGSLANQGYPLYYHYTKSTTYSSSNSSCTKILGFIPVCGYVSTSTSSVSKPSVTESRTPVSNVAVNNNITAKINELKGYVNNASMITYSNNGMQIVIYSKDGNKYVLDRSMPIQANPTTIINSAGVSEYMFWWDQSSQQN